MQKEPDKSSETPKINTSQEQIHDLLFSRELGWQEIIYDLINTEQLDAWNIDIIILTNKYLDRVRAMEEADFFISSKVLLAASLLLKIKSEVLLNKYIKSIDEILFGNKPSVKTPLERIELEEEIPELIIKSPIPRFKKVTLQELINSLNKAITTENRRIKKEIINKNAFRQAEISIPKRKFSVKDKIKEIYSQLFLHLKDENIKKKISFKELIGDDKEEKIIAFLPLLHLDSQKKIWLDQEIHFDEIFIWLKDVYFRHNPDPFAELREEIKEQLEELDSEQKSRLSKINKNKNPLEGI